MSQRTVKFARKPGHIAEYVVPELAQHWAVKVGETWYEVNAEKGRNAEKGSVKRLIIDRSQERTAESGAGFFGGELAGKTKKTDQQINKWIVDWLEENTTYDAVKENCQKFAYEFVNWLTNGNFICSHRFNAATTEITDNDDEAYSLAMAEGGNAVARFACKEQRVSRGPASASGRFLNLQAQAIAGPGFGAWADASAFKAEASFGNVVGVHVEPNVNTGIGVRNGNFEAHLLGFGFKKGADGGEINTPLGGINAACRLM